MSRGRTVRDRIALRAKHSRVNASSWPHGRRLRFEPLEDRRLLAVFTVSNLDDAGIGSLRDAIVQANLGGGPDIIQFAAGMSGGTISLSTGAMRITEALVIDARPLAANVTIHANELSRIFNITATTGDFTFGGLMLLGGRTTADGSAGRGGAIRSLSTGNLTLDQSTVSGNTTAGEDADGGGIFSNGAVTLTQSTVSGNSTTGYFADGGGIRAYGGVTLTRSTVSGNSTVGNIAHAGGILGSSVTLIESTVSGNTTTGVDADGGGILAVTVSLTRSSVSGNSTAGFRGYGGGFWAVSAVTLTQSTVSGNSTAGNTSNGGGMFLGGGTQNPAVTLTQSTVSGNFTTGQNAHGGGIYIAESFGGGGGHVTLIQSTVTQNVVWHFTSRGGGLFHDNGSPLSISGSILADNLESFGSSGQDLVPGGALTVNYSLIGTDVTPSAGGNNIVTDDPQLGPLINNGGPTPTHALLAGSPAIDVGDPSIAFNPAGFDQRGAPFARVFDGDSAGGARIDIGAYERQTLAGLNLIVDIAADENNGDYSGGDLSLREAIGLANGSPGANTITFAAALSGATITLGGTELVLGETLVIDARPLAENVTIDANQQSLIFNITSTGDVTLGGLTITGGRNTNGSGTLERTGGAIRSLSFGNLTLDQSTVSGNSTTGNLGYGGGIFSNGTVTLTQSTVSGNNTAGNRAFGGGVVAGSVTLIQSTVSGNSTTGPEAHGGGVFAGSVTLIESTVSGNRTAGSLAHGGGIWASGAVTLIHSTVTQNHALVINSTGGGVFQSDSANQPFSISGSIVAGNTASGGGPDVVNDPQSTLAVYYSLVGTGVTLDPDSSGNNIVTNAAQLPALADNGGPTQTHALLAGSPAIDAGDPAAVAGVGIIPPYDQRGFPYSRVIDGDGTGPPRIDIGAFEVHLLSPAEPPLVGDYNSNGVVDAADYVVWRKTVGAGPMAAFANADGDGNGAIGQGDYGVWRVHFGQSLPGAADSESQVAGQASSAGTSVQSDVDSALENEPATALPTTQVAGAGTISIAEPGAGRELVWLADAERSPRVPPRPDATATWGRTNALPHDNALLAWLSSSHFAKSPLADDIGSSRHSNEDATQSDGSEASSVDEIYAGLASARYFDF